MATMSMVKISDDGLTVFLPNGGTATFDSVQSRDAALQMLGVRAQAGGGGGTGFLRAAANAGEAIFSGITAARLNEYVRDAREDERDLRRAQDALVAQAKASSGLPAGFAAALEKVFTSQRRVDRSQNRALGSAVTAEVVHAVGGAARVVSDLAPGALSNALTGGDSAGGMGAGASLLLGGVGGYALAELWRDDDDRDRYRDR